MVQQPSYQNIKKPPNVNFVTELDHVQTDVKHNIYSSHSCGCLRSLSTRAQSLGVGMASITVELGFTFCCQTVCWLLFFRSISSDIGRLDVTPTIVTASFTCKVVSQNITVVHSNHVLQCTYAVGPVARVCTAVAFPTHLHFDTGGKEGSWWQWHHWLPYRQRHWYSSKASGG